MIQSGSQNNQDASTIVERKQDDCTVGVGLLPSRDDSIHHMGHMWIRWLDPFTAQFHYREYWPVMDDLPDSLSDEEIRDYLCKNSVRGLYRLDTEGQKIEERGQRYRKEDWNFTERAFFRLTMQRCYLPDGVKSRLSGYYSCSEELPNTNNCSSWAITSLRYAREDANFIPCERIKRLRYVEIAIWCNNLY